MQDELDNPGLCYIEASRVEGPDGALSDIDLCDMHDQRIGSLEGVVVDPVERRLRFFVVGSETGRGMRHYLLPTEWPAQVAPGGRTLRIDADSDQLADCDEFAESDVHPYSDGDFLASLFRPGVA